MTKFRPYVAMPHPHIFIRGTHTLKKVREPKNGKKRAPKPIVHQGDSIVESMKISQ